MRCLLLQAEGFGEVVLEALPAGTVPQDVLQHGQIYQASVAECGGRLYWTQHSALAWQQNQLASGLANMQVCGDAVLVLPEPSCELQLQRQVQQLASKHLRKGTEWRVCGAWSCSSTAGASGSSSSCSSHMGSARGPVRSGTRRKRSLEHHAQQQAMLLQLLRRPVPGGARREAAIPATAVGEERANDAAQAAAPATPPRQLASAAIFAQPTPAFQPQQGRQAEAPHAERGTAVHHRQHLEHLRSFGRQPLSQAQAAPASGQHEARLFECEPRQQLLWSIAGRATSLSWQGGTAATTEPSEQKPAARPHVASTGDADACVPLAVAPPAAAGLNTHSAPGATSAAPSAAGVGSPSIPLQPPLGASAAAAAPRSPRATAPAKHCGSLERSRWAELQPEILALVLAHTGHSSRVARAVSQVCSGWRQGVGAERCALRLLRFSRLDHLGAADESGGGADDCSAAPATPAADQAARSSRKCSRRPALPWLVEQAVKAGNVEAAVVAARFLEQGGCPSSGAAGAPASAVHAAGTWGGKEPGAAAVASRGAQGAGAARYWARGAKAGHPEAQWKLGYAHYKGLMGLSHDCEEAHMWLLRAAKQLEEVVVAAAGNGGAAAVQQAPPLPPLMSLAACRQVLAQAAHILGYLLLDGEGTRPDTAAAIRWFRVAERHGCRDAGRVLGYLFNTGQYA